MKKIIFGLALVLSGIVPALAAVQASTLIITTQPPLPDAISGQPYNAAVNFSYDGPFALNAHISGLPSGIHANGLASDPNNVFGIIPGTGAGVLLSGSSTQIGTYAVTVNFEDQHGLSASRNYALTVAQPGTFTLNQTALPDATLGQPYSANLHFGYTGTYAANAHISGLPSGIHANGLASDPNNVYGLLPVNNGGFDLAFSGTPNQTGSFTVTMLLDATTNQITKTVTLNVNPGTALQITPETLPAAILNQPYSTQLHVAGGTAPYTLNVLSTTYPSGCCVLGFSGNNDPSQLGLFTFNTQSSPVVTGNPGTYTWTVQIIDSVGNTATKTISLTVNPTISTDKPTLILSSNFVNFSYTQGQAVPSSVEIHIFNQSATQTANLNISVPNQPAWLNGSYATGTLPLNPQQVMGLGVAVDPTKVGPGSYQYNIGITGDFANSPLNIKVSLNVISAAVDNLPVNPPVLNPGNLPDGSVIQFTGNPTVYLVIGGQLQPFSTPQQFLGAGYNWSDIQQIDPNQTNSGNSGLFLYPSGSLVNDRGTIYLVAGHSKVPFASAQAFTGQGYSFKNVINGDVSNYVTRNYLVDNPAAAHAWGTWLTYKGTVYYVSSSGLIGVPSADIFSANSGNWNLVVKANAADIAALNANPNLLPLTANDPRVQL